MSIHFVSINYSAAKNRQNSLNPPILGFKVIDLDIPKKLVTSACYDSSMCVPICNHFHGRRANNGKITSF